jgi:hypothetical protein
VHQIIIKKYQKLFFQVHQIIIKKLSNISRGNTQGIHLVLTTHDIQSTPHPLPALVKPHK